MTSHATLTDRVQRALAAADLPPLSWFEILAAVKRSPTGRPRMSELAEWLTLSRGGITKLVDRLQEAGYLERVSCPTDRRSLQAELTPAGERMLGEMRLVYEAELGQHLQLLSAEEAELVAAALNKLTASTCAGACPPLRSRRSSTTALPRRRRATRSPAPICWCARPGSRSTSR